jgi:hypothetical protein
MAGCKVSKGASVASSMTTPSTLPSPSGASHGRGCRQIFVVDVAVLVVSPLKQARPISIQSNLPHIILKLGDSLDIPNRPKICMAVDTCATLMTGSFHFYTQIAKRFPHCVAKIMLLRTTRQSTFQGSCRRGRQQLQWNWRCASSSICLTRPRKATTYHL